ncbi:MAG: hypothetical protein ACRD3L_00780 [Terriglobales bacterium]
MREGKVTPGGRVTRSFYVGCLLALVLVAALPVAAHVGSPDVYYEGDAGPYHLFVTVRVPQVIPGIAQVEIRSRSNDVTQVGILALSLTGAGAKYPPSPESTQRSKEDPQFFTGNLWFMEFGSIQVRLRVDGIHGKAELSVPVPAISQRTLKMSSSLATILFCLTIVLAFGAVAIATAAAREAELVPGTKPAESDLRRARVVMVAASILCVALLYGGKRWWDTEKAVANANIYQIPRISGTLESGSRLLLSLQPTKTRTSEAPRGWVNAAYMSDLIPDHNHLMHLFLIRLPRMDYFFHLHPTKTDDGQFMLQLPDLPAGRYQIFADVVHQNGFPTTMVGEVELPSISNQPLTGDNSEWDGAAISTGAKETTKSSLPDGTQMVWENPPTPLKSQRLIDFHFRVEYADGKPVSDLEPYMGMAAHAEFVRSDLSVFAHVHPSGSAPMAAVELAQAGLLPYGGQMQSMTSEMVMPTGPLPPEVSFPYGFPKAGDYRLFIQVKRQGRVETGVFDVRVE